MLCTRCKIRPAVVFITKMENNETKNEGICLKCASELGIKQVDEMMKNMAISPEEIESMTSDLMSIMPEEDENFSEGGAQTFPFLQKVFGESFKDQPKKDTKEATKPKNDKQRKFLDTYCINLTEKAKNKTIDNIIGREAETARVIQILNRRTKNNPCLIGEPGVGKTAVAEGIAIKIASGNVPSKLVDKEIMLLDLTAMVAGTQFRGQFEGRMKSLIDEVKKCGNIILVIDEAHNLVGAGESEGAMNAANILKPALSRGEIQIIAATTFNEYRKFIEKDGALERRLQPVTINEPTIEETVEILKGIAGYYEKYHNVQIPYDTLASAAELSERYITDRFLPDKAIDLLDEACSLASISDKASNDMFVLKKQLDSYDEEKEQLSKGEQNEKYYADMATLKSKELAVIEKLEALQKDFVPQVINIEHLAKVIELWTGIPASKIKESELVKLKTLDLNIKERIVGQDEAIESVCRAIRRNRVGISPKRKPVSFIFAGPTGVGKTEFVKTLSAVLFDSVETMIRLDMSEFMEKHSVSRIIGSPPGYIGYDEAGQLTEKIRRKPYSVILFDEIEKAHPDVMNILLQILDDGRITDAHGRTVNFENTIIVMTTNAGSNIKEGQMGFNKTYEVASKEKAMKALSEFLRPEFINRIGEVIVFKPLTKEHFRDIAVIMLDDLKKNITKRYNNFCYDEAVLDWLSEKSFSEKYGARNLKREIEKSVEDKIAAFLIDNANKKINSIKLVVNKENIEVTEC